jgi:uncharacterized protein
MSSIIDFIVFPKYIKAEKINWIYFFRLWSLLLFIVLLFSPVGYLARKFVDLPEKELNAAPFLLFLLMVFLGPALEEVFFRLFLKPNYKNMIFLLILFFTVAIFSFLKGNMPILLFSFFAITLLLVILSRPKNLYWFQRIVLKHFRWVFYFSCFLFGAIHILNFEHLNYKLFLAAPFIIFPQVVAGVFLGFVRMKYGIIFSVLFHSLINFFPAVFESLNLLK